MRVVKEVGKWVRMLQTELEGGRGIHNNSGEFKEVVSKSRSFLFWLHLGGLVKLQSIISRIHLRTEK